MAMLQFPTITSQTSSATTTSTAAGPTDFIILSAIASIGYPILIMLESGTMFVEDTGGGNVSGQFFIIRDSTTIATYTLEAVGVSAATTRLQIPASLSTLDTPAGGSSYVYKLTATLTAGTSIEIDSVIMTAIDFASFRTN